MLKKRSRAVSSKQGLMSDSSSIPSPTGKFSRVATSSLFPSPRLFVSPKGFSDSEPAMSPTSILETKPFSSSMVNPFCLSDRNSIKSLHEPPTPTTAAPISTTAVESKHHPWCNGDSKAIGLGIVDALTNKKTDEKSSKPESRMVLFGSQLKIQIPPEHSVDSTHSPIEFGIKTKHSQLALYSPVRRSSCGSANIGSEVSSSSPWVLPMCLSTREMELSEDYTCVISHGPNPKTTHIFDNCIVQCCGDAFIPLRDENRHSPDRLGYSSDDFLSYCYACKKNLRQGKDIFMYRGEKAFCSPECRYQEMLFDEEGTERCSQEAPIPL